MDDGKEQKQEVNITDGDLQKIADQIIQESGEAKQNLLENEFRNHTMLSGKYVRDDWDDSEYIATLYDDVYLKCVQQGHRDQSWTFDQCLSECLQTLEWRRLELKRELALAIIDQRTYQNALAICDMAEGAIKKYRELPERIQLIGV